ncbi:hypothetical protein IAD21_06066 [Abditibacteriota bacterium]|nr:hypothetical protein IAD21_06066 [Abditibacteriota bacterium]
MIKAESHLLAAASPAVGSNIKKSLNSLKTLLAQTENDLGTFVQNSPFCQEKAQFCVQCQVWDGLQLLRF